MQRETFAIKVNWGVNPEETPQIWLTQGDDTVVLHPDQVPLLNQWLDEAAAELKKQAQRTARSTARFMKAAEQEFQLSRQGY